MRWLSEEIRGIVHARVRSGWAIDLAPLVELKERLERMLARPGVKEDGPRLESLAWGFEEVRRAMRMERDLRTRGEVGPLLESDVEQVKAAVARTGEILRGKGEARITERWRRLERKFRDEEPLLWVTAGVPGQTRSTVALERAHRVCRTGVRHRTGQSDTGEAMELLGTPLA